MVFVLDDNVYTDIVLSVTCDRHEAHSVRLVLEKADPETARTFLGFASRLTLRCTDKHEHPMERIQRANGPVSYSEERFPANPH